MQSLFSPDSRFMQYLIRLYDLCVLNLLFLLTCLPLFTIGAANAALYTVCFRMDSPREAGIFKTYFRAFRDNFRQGTVLWLILALFGTACIVNMALFSQLGGALQLLWALFAVLLALDLVLFSYVFPLLSLFSNSTKEILKNALILGVGYLPRTIAAVLINIFPWAILVMNLYAFFNAAFAWAFLYFSAAAFGISRLLKGVFAPYLNDKEETV